MGVLTGWMQVRWIYILGLRSVRRSRLCVDGLVGLGGGCGWGTRVVPLLTIDTLSRCTSVLQNR